MRVEDKTQIEMTRIEARELSRKAGQHSEPYRGYGHDLKDGRILICAPDGNFYVRPLNEGWKLEEGKHLSIGGSSI